jgi:hypothetical protein
MPLARHLLAFLLAAALPTAAGAAPMLRYSWDACDPPVPTDKSWAGPGIYTQVLSVSGLASPISGFGVSIGWGTYISSAWSFYDGGPCWGSGVACQGSARLTAVPTGGSCASIPGSTLTVMPLFCGITDPHWNLYIRGVIDPPLEPDPGTRYTLAVLQYDHRRSAAGTQDPAVACGDAEQGRCFAIASAGTSTEPLLFENGFVSWQDPANLSGCPGSTPVRNHTWGRIKSLYR